MHAAEEEVYAEISHKDRKEGEEHEEVESGGGV